MQSFFITFRSVTYAQKGERLLEAQGIPCSLQRTPRWMEEQGCGYCLKLRRAEPAVDALRQARVPFRRVYRQLPDGNVEEVRL